MNKIFALFIILLLSSFINQNKGLKLDNINKFAIDIQSNMYFVSGNELQKFSSANKLLYTFSNPLYGDITVLEVEKLTSLFLYYKDFNEIVFLDNTLSVKNSPIDVTELGYSESNLACSSYNNSFWIYDPINQELLRFNQALQNTDRTGNLNNITSYNINPKQIIERNNNLYLRDDKNGIFVFDRYGGFLRRMPFMNLDDFYLSSNKWNMLRNDTSFIFDPISLIVDTIVVPIPNVSQIIVNNNKIFYLTNNHNFGISDINK